MKNNCLTFSQPVIKDYYIGIIRIDENNIFSKEYIDTANKCFSLIQKHDGDVNQFLGGIILALWGVPLSFTNDKDNCLNFFDDLKKSNLPVSVILKRDKGLYGAFGDGKRTVVTAISKVISNTLNEIMNCNNGTFTNDLKQQI